MSDVEASQLELARSWIDEARRIVVLTGAGISTESGIPDFRGPNGVWTKDPEAEKMSTLQIYVADPDVRKRAWRFHLDRGWDAKPNRGHAAIASLETRGKLALLITQNVDGLHHDAGHERSNVVEIHGNFREVECLSCHERAPMERALARVRAGEDDPPCRSCGGILKSATISFGQQLVEADLRRAQEAAENCDLMLAAGSTLGVYPAAAVVPIAREHGARIVIANGGPTEMDAIADALVRGPLGETLPQLVAPTA